MKILLISLLVIALLVSISYLVLHSAPFGSNPKGKRLEKIKTSPNYKEGQFHNQSETIMMAEDADYWSMTKQFIFKTNPTEPNKTLPSVKRDLKAAPDSMPQITWFGHSSYLIQWNGKNILVDPVFSQRASPFQFMGSKQYQGTEIYSIDDFPTIDLVLITHDHYDHLDYGTIKQLKQVPQFITPLGVGQHLERWGIKEQQITELDWWDTNQLLGDFTLICAPARHFSGRGLVRNKTLWASYILMTEDFRLYLGGDSGYDSHFETIGRKYGPFDLAILESGQYNDWWPQIHMMPEETVQAAYDLQANVLLPVHWGKFSLALHSYDDPIERVLAKAPQLNVQLCTPMIGEAIVLTKSYPNSFWWQDAKN